MKTNYLLSCNISPLVTYVPNAENPWNAANVRHLHNRLGFGIAPSQIENALSKSPSAYVDEIIDAAISLPPTTPPDWALLDPADYAANGYTYGEDENDEFVNETQYVFIKELMDNGIRGRLTLFWHNILVTRVSEYRFAGYAFRYFLALQRHSFGNFKTFIREIGLDEAMLKFLNGFDNVVGHPNENYARELYELFTLGEGNGYTEDDIVETSRALTGYNELTNGENSRIEFLEENFDAEPKTIFGQTGNWGYDDVINILFEQKSDLIAKYICERLYIDFVSPEVDESIRALIINPLASQFIASNFEIAPILKTLFKSAHFFDKNAKNVIIKSPLDFIIQFMTSTGFNFGSYDLNKQSIKNMSRIFDQDILNPPTVAGWEGDRDWLNSGTIMFRPAYLSEDVMQWAWDQDEEQFRQFAITISGNSNNPEVISTAIFEALMNEIPYTQDDFDIGVDVFKSRVPSNYFEQNIWTLDFETAALQVRDLMAYIVSLPDYQIK
ncbi:DUF1800 domain-containing protein [Aureibaculum marinum]|uniref:DUF1800 domain-containing protein n=1 Tax=Aureibaculum marinum TaxID=2487930 RepID=A0A3N4NVF8_9FLAO|nr:DUF1800 domain-containing protein [Aureibaculum marinum]RPD96160.1 DUF1800 domain-containing protein [Aureibaculum marinum]